MKPKFINMYMDWAKRAAELSHAQRLHVGAVIVKDDTVISYGYNGMPAGWENDCEDKEWMGDAGGWLDPEEIKERWPYEGEYYDSSGYAMKGRYRLKTRPEVLHAERNALDKLAKRGGVGSEGASIFITHAPCIECAKSIYSAGIIEVFYNNNYRSEDGVYFLKKCGVNVTQLTDNDYKR